MIHKVYKENDSEHPYYVSVFWYPCCDVASHSKYQYFVTKIESIQNFLSQRTLHLIKFVAHSAIVLTGMHNSHNLVVLKYVPREFFLNSNYTL
jgi:hypothetical protein